jgi:hypothetical protein
MIYIGIDNGLSGALVAISSSAGLAPIKMTAMPTRGKAKGNEVDGAAVYEWLLDLDTAFDRMTIILETPGKHSPGVQALCSMWDSYGCIRGILECRGIRHHRITPQSWQKKMLPGCAKGDTKQAALAKAKQLWPSESWLASPRCKTPHSGYIDAALIGEFGRISRL